MKVTFDFATRQIAIDGDAPELVKVLELVRGIAPLLPQINIHTEVGGTSPPAGEKNSASQPPVNGRQRPMREWARRLNLANHIERVTALGYYATKIDGKPSFSPKEMSDWYNHCGWQKPSQMPVAIFNARTRYGYLEAVGQGQSRLTNSGENLVIGKLEEVRE
jgi:hypothetical protein